MQVVAGNFYPNRGCPLAIPHSLCYNNMVRWCGGTAYASDSKSDGETLGVQIPSPAHGSCLEQAAPFLSDFYNMIGEHWQKDACHAATHRIPVDKTGKM